jgi:hypothetical protein
MCRRSPIKHAFTVYVLLLLSSSSLPGYFTKSKSSITNLLTYFHLIASLVTSQGQADTTYFDLISAFDHVPHTRLLQKHHAFGLTDGYVNWFCTA